MNYSTLSLQVIVITSSPLDYCSLGVERERSSLEQALKPLSDNGQVNVKWLEKPTLIDIHHCLRDGEYHIFHFIGHGGFDDKTHEGVLLLEDGQGKGCLTGAHRISTLLHDQLSLRLAVLNSCEGARNSRNDPFAGVAAGLIRQGIPAVVAMQFEITDSAAIIFSGEFYAAISRGFPVDAAVAEARKAIYASYNEIEWGTPVLYMRSPDGVLFDIQVSPPVDVPTVPIKETSEPGASPRDIIIQAQELSGIVTGGTKKPGNDAEKIAGIIVIILFVSIIGFYLPGIFTQKPQVPQQPSLSVSPDLMSLNLGNMSTGETTIRTFSISNTGEGTLNWNVSLDLG